MSNTIFDVTPDEIASLNDEQLRELIAKLCQSECTQNDLPYSAISWGGHQNSGDGGIDVRASFAVADFKGDFIPRSETGFQAKGQDMPASAIREEMSPNGELLESIIDIGKRSGSYVIVSSKGSVSDKPLKNRLKAMEDCLAILPPEERPHVDFYDRRRLTDWVNRYPPVASWVRVLAGRSMSGWRSYDDWSSKPGEIDDEYVLDDSTRLHGPDIDKDKGLSSEEGINVLREILARKGAAVRLVGLSGVGKTRLVQALFDERIGKGALPQHLALYTDITHGPEPVPLELIARIVVLKQSAVLIVDNCTPKLHQELVQKLRQANSNLSLITIEYDITDDEPEGTSVFKLEPSSDETLNKIVLEKYPHIGHPNADSIVKFSSGNARVALALAATLRSGEDIGSLKDSELFERLFSQRKGNNNELLRASSLLSLVYSFDIDPSQKDESETAFLGDMGSLGEPVMSEAVAELSRRQLVQSRSHWRAVLPHAIANRLAKRALENYGGLKIERYFREEGSVRLLKSFSRRLSYLHDNREAQKIAQFWLGENGFLESVGDFNDVGLTMFRSIAPINTKATLDAIARSFVAKDGFDNCGEKNRSLVTETLRHLAYEPSLFDESVRILIDICKDTDFEDHNNSILNNLRELFWMYLSGTEAKTDQRIGIVRSLLLSKDSQEREIGLLLLRSMLKTSMFSSFLGFEFGARARRYGWEPVGSEIRGWLDQSLQLVVEVANKSPSLRDDLKKLFSRKFRWLWTSTDMRNELEKYLFALKGDEFWPEIWLATISIIRLDKKEEQDTEFHNRLEALSEKLKPISLEDRIRTYTASSRHGLLDMVEILAVDDDYSAAHKLVEEQSYELGKEAMVEPETLRRLLPEIIASDVYHIWHFGKGVGEVVDLGEAANLWEEALSAIVASSKQKQYAFLRGYIQAVANRDRNLTSRFLDDLLENPERGDMFVDFQIRHLGRPNDDDRVRQSFEREHIPLWTYANFQFAMRRTETSDRLLYDVIQFLIGKGDDGIAIAKDIMNMRAHFIADDSLSSTQIERDLCRLILLKTNYESKSRKHDYELMKIASVAFEDQDTEELAERLCEKIASSLYSYRAYCNGYGNLVRLISEYHPLVVLDRLIGNPSKDDVRSLSYYEDLRDSDKNIVGKIPLDTILDWAVSGSMDRFRALANVIHFREGGEEGASYNWTELAMELINAAPDKIGMAEQLAMRFRPMSWSGSRADIMARYTPLLEMLSDHEDVALAQWAAERLKDYQIEIANERKWEAERDRGRDERFED